jgi:murein DD-endopeptidase MepM/ murein hydrolase activator NlpD
LGSLIQTIKLALKRKNKDSDAPKELTFWERIKKKSRVTISDLDSYEVKRFVLLSPLQLIIGSLFTIIVFIFATWFLIAYTSLRQSIPGYPKINEEDKIKRQDIENIKKLDSLLFKLESIDQYNKNLLVLLNEQVLENAYSNDLDSTMLLDSSKITKLTLDKSPEDSLLRAKFFAAQKYGVHYENNTTKTPSDVMAGVFFFPPLKGEVASEVNFKKNIFGIHIIAPKDEAVKSTLDGTVILAEWSPEYGYVVYIQHAYNVVSVYKYNSVILKKTGELVKAGEPIAIIGSSGAKSEKGNQLYFELWYNGLPLDPLKFVTF